MKTWIDTLESAAQHSAALYLGALTVSALLGAGVWALLRSKRDWNAATRFALWSAALAATALWLATATFASFRGKSPTATAVRTGNAIASSAAAGLDDADDEATPRVSLALPHSTVSNEGAFVPSIAPQTSIATLQPLRVAWSILTVLLAVGWAAGAIAQLARIAWQIRGLRRLKREAVALPPDLQAAVPRTLNAGSRRIAILASARVRTPVAAGLGAPCVLLPLDLASELNEDEIAHVIRHEVAHLQRRDDWTQLVQRVLEAILWPLPTTGIIAREASLACEMACDDRVLSETSRTKIYARCLTKIAGLRLESPAALLAPGMAAGTKSNLFRRVEAILARAERSGSPRAAWRPVALAMGVFALTTFGLHHAWAALPEASPGPGLSSLLIAQTEAPAPSAPVIPRTDRDAARAERDAARSARDAARLTRDRVRSIGDEVRDGVMESLQAAREALIEGQEGVRESVMESLQEAREGVVDAIAEARENLPEEWRGFNFSFTTEDDRPMRKLTPELLALLSRSALEDPDSEVRVESINTLARGEGQGATNALLRVLESAKDDASREAALNALGRRQKDNPAVTARILEAAKVATATPRVREAALRALARSGTDDSVRGLIAIYDASPGAPLKESVIRSLGRLSGRSKVASDKLASIAREDPDAKLRKSAIQQLARCDEGANVQAWMPRVPRPPKPQKAPAIPDAPLPPAAPSAPSAPASPAAPAAPSARPETAAAVTLQIAPISRVAHLAPLAVICPAPVGTASTVSAPRVVRPRGVQSL